MSTEDKNIAESGSEEQNEQQKQQQENKNKIAKAFDANIGKIRAILEKEPDKKGKRKVTGDAMKIIVAELFKEDDENLQKEVRKELRELLTKYVSMWDEIGKKEKEMEKLKEEKMKEFNEASQKLFNKIDGLPAIMQRYAEALKTAAGAAQGEAK